MLIYSSDSPWIITRRSKQAAVSVFTDFVAAGFFFCIWAFTQSGPSFRRCCCCCFCGCVKRKTAGNSGTKCFYLLCATLGEKTVNFVNVTEQTIYNSVVLEEICRIQGCYELAKCQNKTKDKNVIWDFFSVVTTKSSAVLFSICFLPDELKVPY